MFVPIRNRMRDLNKIHQFITENSFGVIISHHAADQGMAASLCGTHIPFVLRETEGEFGTLYGHMAKANKQWGNLINQHAMIVFRGPHGYISPTWYQKTPAVPTWNYMAVHAYGQCTVLNDDELLTSVDELNHKFEPNLGANKDPVEEAFVDKLLAGIVGFSIKISRFDAQMKLGQERSQDDLKGIYKGLMRGDLGSQALADCMTQNLNLQI